MPAAPEYALRSVGTWLVVVCVAAGLAATPPGNWWVSVLLGLGIGTGLRVYIWWMDSQQPAVVEEFIKTEVVRDIPPVSGPDYLDTADAAVIAVSPGGEVVYCNSAAGELLGFRAARAVGRRVEDVFTQGELLNLLRAAGAGRPVTAQVRVGGPGGLRTLEASARQAPGGWVVLALRDVTELARAVQVKSEFVANASHELRTPITALRMAVDTLAAGAADEPATRARLLETISGNTARLEEMVRDLLDLSRLESPESRVQIEPVPAPVLAEALQKQFEGVCRERGLSLAVDFGIGELRTDRALLLVILRNLVENATKFAYEGTTVRVTGVPDGTGGLAIEVADRGIGIPIQHQQRVFERYYQVDAARTLSAQRRGTGLGLAIVKHAVRRLGGSVRLESVWKEGTAVTVDLPGAAASWAGGAPGAAESGP